jgi:predicted DCC family thiol-disulfide oxidoreductase YuxK
MKTLTIFYDPRCGMCAKFRVWLEAQPKRVGVEFLGFDTPEAKRRFPGLLEIGRWWQGSAAWLTCLWTTARFRDWSFRLADPLFQPFVKKAVHLLSENRLTLSRLMSLRTDAELADALGAVPASDCASGACHL